MSRADDLASVFAGPRDQGASPFRQALVLSFNQETGEGTYDLTGTVLSDLPLLSSAESLEYSPGDVVVLLRMGPSFAVLGRVVRPNGANRLAPSAVAFDAVSQQETNFAVNTFGSGLVKVTATLTVPPWANAAAVIAMGICVGKQPTTPVPAGSVMTTRMVIDGSTEGANNTQGWVDTTDNTVAQAYPSLSRAYAVPPGGTITCQIEAWASGGWGVNSSNYARIHALGMFHRDD